MIDNAHWYYTWMIPSGSDEEGAFVVHIYACDIASNTLSPYPTSDASKKIDNTIPLISNISVDTITTTSVRISWETNENTTGRIEYGTSLAFGSQSQSSNEAMSHLVNLDDLKPGTKYYYRVVSYDSAGNQATSTHESVTTLSQPSKKETSVESIPNAPPSNPKIEGPNTGRSTVVYTFTARSVDADSNTISYTFDWGDGNKEYSEVVATGTNCTRNHSWMQAGKYTLIVTVNDTTSDSSSKMIIWIDAVDVGSEGYLLDNDGDGLFDVFYNEKTGGETETQLRGDLYLIDVNGDRQWDYEFNASSGSLSWVLRQQQNSINTSSSPLLLISGIVLVVFFMVVFIILYRRRSSKQQ
jgi:hypothetical protein